LSAFSLRPALVRLPSGATVVGIKASLLKQVPISFPKSVSVQIEIAASIEESAVAADRLEQNYRAKLSHLASLKQALLQKAFSGELALPPSSVIKEAAE
jgi:type I restriction enzyme S subunit